MPLSLRQKTASSAVPQVLVAENEFLRLEACELGASLLSLKVKTSRGLQEVLRGEADIPWRLQHYPYYNAAVGPVANRLGEVELSLASGTVVLDANEGKNHLHGGARGYHSRIWQGSLENPAGLVFRLQTSPEDDGYPGERRISWHYQLVGPALCISFDQLSSAETLFNPCFHAYFNLNPKAATIEDQELLLRAEAFLPRGEDKCPTGELRSLKATAMDFTSPRRLGDALRQIEDDPQLGELDHYFVLENSALMHSHSLPDNSRFAPVELYSAESGLLLQATSELPGLQVYACKSGDSKKSGHFTEHFACCLEFQKYPDALRHPSFPSIIQRPGERCSASMRFTFRESPSPFRRSQ